MLQLLSQFLAAFFLYLTLKVSWTFYPLIIVSAIPVWIGMQKISRQ